MVQIPASLRGTAPEAPHLRRELGLAQSTALAITDMVGIGPYITIPLLLATMGGPRALLAWFVGAAIAFSDGLVWAELGAAFPKAGGSYNYLREAFGPAGAGRWLSFLMVWQIMFSAPLSVASGSIGFANYCHYLAPGMPAWGERALAGLFPLLLVVLLYRHIGAIGNLSIVLAVGVLGGCLWIVVSGLPHLSAARLLSAPGAASMSWAFWAALGHATLYALYDYFGYYNVCYLAEEIRDPGRVIPRAILFSIATVGALYVLMTSSFLSVMPLERLLHTKFVASDYIGLLEGAAAGKAMTLLLLWIAFSSVFSLLLGYSRIPYAAALDGNFFRVFGRLHPEGRFPYVSLIVLGVIASVFSLGRLNEVIGSLIATRVLIQYLPQTIGFFVLRRRRPGLERPFRMWFYPLPGLISIAGWIYVLATAAPRSLIFAFAVLVAGSAFYFVRARSRREWPFQARSITL
ncbi:MAG TPA: APC family permease [Terriglobia bacterium]|jgi:fructoselysine transporter|nr:APC family permease [Terriglobia bacterium]